MKEADSGAGLTQQGVTARKSGSLGFSPSSETFLKGTLLGVPEEEVPDTRPSSWRRHIGPSLESPATRLISASSV